MKAEEKSRILIVGDSPSDVSSYKEIFASPGEEILIATSVSEALNLLSKHDVAVVLLGLDLNGNNGYDLAGLISRDPSFHGTAIIFLSGSALADADQIQRSHSNLVDYLPSPVIPEMLHARVRVFVELHRKTRMLERMNLELERRVGERAEELNRSQEDFRTRADLLELASEAIIVRSLDDGSIRFWNSGAESLYGWQRDEVLGKDIHGLLRTIFPDSREETEGLLRQAGAWHGNLVQQTRGEREIVVACRKTLNREGNAVLEVSRDITAQLHAEEALRESEKLAAMGRVAGIIAHEINNPLTAITNIFYLLQNHSSLDAEARSYADIAEKELARVSHITRQTLSFYRETKQPVPLHIHELVDDVVELQKRALQANHIAVSKQYLPASEVNGFPVELRQVFLNLITNAIQAMPEGGTLRLHVHEATDWRSGLRGPAVSVLDTGAGIRSEDAKRLFEPFFSTKAAKGTGLGLWISKGILQKYNGHISYRSHRENGGCVTCFRVFLPGNPAWSSATEPPVTDRSYVAPEAVPEVAAVSNSAGAGSTVAAVVFAPCT